MTFKVIWILHIYLHIVGSLGCIRHCAVQVETWVSFNFFSPDLQCSDLYWCILLSLWWSSLVTARIGKLLFLDYLRREGQRACFPKVGKATSRLLSVRRLSCLETAMSEHSFPKQSAHSAIMAQTSQSTETSKATVITRDWNWLVSSRILEIISSESDYIQIYGMFISYCWNWNFLISFLNFWKICTSVFLSRQWIIDRIFIIFHVFSSLIFYLDYQDFFFLKIIVFYVFWHLSACLSLTMSALCAGACGGQRGILDTLELGDRWLWATMWILKIEPRSSEIQSVLSSLLSHLTSLISLNIKFSFILWLAFLLYWLNRIYPFSYA